MADTRTTPASTAMFKSATTVSRAGVSRGPIHTRLSAAVRPIAMKKLLFGRRPKKHTTPRPAKSKLSSVAALEPVWVSHTGPSGRQAIKAAESELASA